MAFLHYLSIPNFFDAPLAISSIPSILSGFPISFRLTAVSFALSLILGLLLTLAQLSHFKIFFYYFLLLCPKSYVRMLSGYFYKVIKHFESYIHLEREHK